MPYKGAQAVACYSKANACLKAGYSPSWACEDWFKEVWPMGSGNVIESSGYRTNCGAPLPADAPTTTRGAGIPIRGQAKNLLKGGGPASPVHTNGHSVYLVPTYPQR